MYMFILKKKIGQKNLLYLEIWGYNIIITSTEWVEQSCQLLYCGRSLFVKNVASDTSNSIMEGKLAKNKENKNRMQQ